MAKNEKWIWLVLGAGVSASGAALLWRSRDMVRVQAGQVLDIVQKSLIQMGVLHQQGLLGPLNQPVEAGGDAQLHAGATEPETTTLPNAAQAARDAGAPESAIQPETDAVEEASAPYLELERGAQPGHNAVARDNLDRTLLDAQDLAPRNDPDAGQLESFGDDQIISDRVSTRLGRALHAEELPRININTQQNGVVYLRGLVRSPEQRERLQRIVEETEGVQSVVNEIQIEQERG